MAIINYKTSLYTYNEFIKENKTNRLSKNEKLEQPGAGVVNFLNVEKIDEIFDYKIDNGSISKFDHKYEEELLDKLLSSKIEIKESKLDVFNKFNISGLLND
jgi:hypothetical protein